jgi:hypothetical protein
MGTRGFIGFVQNGIEKITYNHYDSYPSGVGENVLAWATSANWDKVREQVANLSVVSEDAKPTVEEALEYAIYADRGVSEGDDWYATLRHTQGEPDKILEAGVLIDSHTFPYDSLFAEWGYLIDLDTSTFEVYRGFQKSPPRAGRWATPERVAEEQAQYDAMVADNPHMERGPGMRYYAVSLLATWPLHDLPSLDDFLLSTEGAKE